MYASLLRSLSIPTKARYTTLHPLTKNSQRFFFISLRNPHNQRITKRYHQWIHPHHRIDRFQSQQIIIKTSLRSFASGPESKPKPQRINWLSNRVAKLRLWGTRGTKEDEHWDPWESKVRDLDIGMKNTDVILQNAQASRQRQLEQIGKYQKKAADKEASIRTPLAYAAQKRAEKIPLSQRLRSTWTWLINPRNHLEKFYKDHNPDNLSFTQKCLYIHWRRTLVGFALALVTIPQIPVVREMFAELSRHRDRKRRGVLGLDEFCTPEKKLTKLTFFKTNDWSFDIHYLQKMILRDLYVLKNITESMADITTERRYYLDLMLKKLFDLETNQGSQNLRQLNQVQRDAILNLTQYHTNLTNEFQQTEELSKMITNWEKQVDKARENCDVQVTTFFATYLHSYFHQDRTLEKLIEEQKGIQEWREALEDEYRRHRTRVEEVEMFASQLVGKDLIPYEQSMINQTHSNPSIPSSPQLEQLKVSLLDPFGSKINNNINIDSPSADTTSSQHLLHHILPTGPRRERPYPGLAPQQEGGQRSGTRQMDSPTTLPASIEVSPANKRRPTRYSQDELQQLLNQQQLQVHQKQVENMAKPLPLVQQLGDSTVSYHSQFAQLDKIENKRINAVNAKL